MLDDPHLTAAQPHNNNVMTALAALICLAWIVPGLVAHDPWKPDEAYTFGLVYHVLQGGSWIVPTLAAEPFLDKPPLFVLTAAAFAKLFSFALPPHDGARLASGVYMALAFGFIAAGARELHGPNRGWIAALLVLGCFGLVVRAHQLITDTALFAGMAIGCYGLALMPRRANIGGLLLGTGAGIGFMAKGLIAPGILGIACIVLLLGCSAWRTRKAAKASLIASVALLPWITVWPAALYAESPTLFGQWWSLGAGRLLAVDMPGAAGDRLFYLTLLPWYAWPALPLALWVLWGARYSRFDRPAIQLPAVLFAVSLAVISLSTDAREIHAMPMLIPLGLLATPAVFNMRRGASNAMYWFSVMGFSFFAVVGWVYWSALELGVPQRLSLHLHKLQPAYESHVRWPALLIALLYSGAWIVLLAKLKRRVERPVIVWAAGSALIWGMLMSLFVAYADVSKSYRSMIASLERSLPSSYDCMSSRSLGDPQRAMLHYQSGIITHREEDPAGTVSCELLLVQGIRSDPPEIPPGWHQVWEGTRPGEKDEYFWLYGYGPPPPL